MISDGFSFSRILLYLIIICYKLEENTLSSNVYTTILYAGKSRLELLIIILLILLIIIMIVAFNSIKCFSLDIFYRK